MMMAHSKPLTYRCTATSGTAKHLTTCGDCRRYCALIDQLKPLMVDETYALNAAVYTSLADIEGEANGMTTYDREVRCSHSESIHSQRHEQKKWEYRSAHDIMHGSFAPALISLLMNSFGHFDQLALSAICQSVLQSIYWPAMLGL